MNARPLFLAALLASLSAFADEGMWTFDGFPTAKVEQALGVKLAPGFLEHVRGSAVRLAGGCSASFVSGRGLVLTNHHCARACIEQLSSPQRDLLEGGFLARTEAEELRCPAVEVNQLLSITDVTAEVKKALTGLSGKAWADAQRSEFARLQRGCQVDATRRCDVVSLYRGGRYALYTYRRFQDVRLAWAPEQAVAHFGGDPDNFGFPRASLDAAFLRVWVDGKPLAPSDWLRWSPTGVKDGAAVFVAGNPGSTSRQMTVAQLEYQRDVVLPDRLFQLAEARGLATEYRQRSPEQRRHATAWLYGLENGFKALGGRRDALVDRAFFGSLRDAEDKLKADLAAEPTLAAEALPAFDAIARAVDRERALRLRMQFVAGTTGFGTTLFEMARHLVRGAAERPLPNATRLREYQDANLPALTQRLFSPAPLYPEFETFKMTHALVKLRERLGADDPFVKLVLGQRSPAELAESVVKGTTLFDVAARQALWDGGAAAVAASSDPAVVLARAVDAEARAVRRQGEEEVDPVLEQAGEAIARARFALRGTTTYPDATFSPRLSYGRVRGWQEGPRAVAPFTTLGDAFVRATGREPFALPASWLAAREQLDRAAPLNLCTDNDIIGGNSGSPVIDKKGELVGLIFDGNIESLPGNYFYDEAVNRGVSVDARAIVHALDKVYGATGLVTELTGK